MIKMLQWRAEEWKRYDLYRDALFFYDFIEFMPQCGSQPTWELLHFDSLWRFPFLVRSTAAVSSWNHFNSNSADCLFWLRAAKNRG